jgi:hypothetical protein
MKGMLVAAILIAALNFFPGPIFADCVDLSRATSWAVQNEKKIVIFRESIPPVVITLWGCRATRASDVRLPKPYLCDEEKIIVDGEKCNILSIDLHQ